MVDYWSVQCTSLLTSVVRSPNYCSF